MPQVDRRTTALLRLCSGDAESHPEAFTELLGIVYADLRRRAGAFLSLERTNHNLSATELVREAYGRLVDQSQLEWTGRAYFLAIAARSMRRILIDHARRHGRSRRAGNWQRVTFEAELLPSEDSGTIALDDLLLIDDALFRLGQLDATQAKVVELRFFGGSTTGEIAHVLGMPVRSVERDWTHARSWFRAGHRQGNPRERNTWAGAANSDRHRRVKELFYTVCHLPPEQRRNYLDGECADEPEIRAALQELLRFHVEESSLDAHAARSRTRTGVNELPPGEPISLTGGRLVAERYRILARIGHGGMGEVYRAYDLVLEVVVALKVLHQTDERFRSRLLEEVRLARRVTHPAVCRVFDVGLHEDTVFLTMEYIEGEDLDVHLDNEGRLEPERVIDIGLQLCSGLAAAHEAGVMHRDLKPANVLLDQRGQVHITDFGIARSRGSSERDDVFMGTPAYMAPEQFSHGGSTSEQTDLYALGLLLYELLTGVQTFQADDQQAMFECHRHQLPTPPSALLPDVPEQLEQAILETLRKRPESRPRSARAVAEMLSSAAVSLTLAPAECRLLTVLWCDFAGPVRSWRRLDVEEQRALLHRRKRDVAGIIRRQGGQVVQHLARGTIAHFGFPVASERDSERAVVAGLEILAQAGRINRVPQVAVAVHTGPAILEEVEYDGQRETEIFGDTVDFARLQALAEHGHLTVSGETLSLLRGRFLSQESGHRDVHDLEAPVTAYRILGVDRDNRQLSRIGGRLTPLVGRQRELERLLAAMADARKGRGNALLITGEVGVGKSRLVEAAREQAGSSELIWLDGGCYPHTHDTPFAPLAALVRGAFEIDERDRADVQRAALERGLTRLNESRAPLSDDLAILLALPLTEAVGALATIQRQERAIEAFCNLVLALAEQRPVVLVCEDIQWCDPSSLEALGALVARSVSERFLLLCTCPPGPDGLRPVIDRRFVATVAADAPGSSEDTTMPLLPHLQPGGARQAEAPIEPRVERMELERLSTTDIRDLLTGALAGAKLSSEVLRALTARSDGLPRFAEDLLVATSAATGGRRAGQPPLPRSLQSFLAARLDRLGTAKPVAQMAAALGRDFSYALAIAVAEKPASHVHEALARLVDSGIIQQRGLPPDARYTFSYALLQEAAYQSMLRAQRREFHLRIIEHMPEVDPHTVVARPEVYARHLEAAGEIEKAIKCWRQAGAQAAFRFANQEAIAFLESALALLRPTSEDDMRVELAMQLELGQLRAAVGGELAPQREEAYRRALELCVALDDVPQERLYSSLGLWTIYVHQSRLEEALLVAEQATARARATRDSKLLVFGLYAQIASTFWLARFTDSERLHGELETVYNRERHGSLAFEIGGDPHMLVQVYAGLRSWLSGRPKQALQQLTAVEKEARGAKYTWTLSWLLMGSMWLRILRREPSAARTIAVELCQLARAERFAMWEPICIVVFHWADIVSDGRDADVANLQRAIEICHEQGQTRMWWPFWTGLLADAFAHIGDHESALRAVDEALEQAESTGERWWRSALQTQRGRILLQMSRLDAAKDALTRALDTATEQHAFTIRLRAAMALACLQSERGERPQAHQLLRDVLDEAPPDQDADDVRAARELLDELSRSDS